MQLRARHISAARTSNARKKLSARTISMRAALSLLCLRGSLLAAYGSAREACARKKSCAHIIILAAHLPATTRACAPALPRWPLRCLPPPFLAAALDMPSCHAGPATAAPRLLPACACLCQQPSRLPATCRARWASRMPMYLLRLRHCTHHARKKCPPLGSGSSSTCTLLRALCAQRAPRYCAFAACALPPALRRCLARLLLPSSEPYPHTHCTLLILWSQAAVAGRQAEQQNGGGERAERARPIYGFCVALPPDLPLLYYCGDVPAGLCCLLLPYDLQPTTLPSVVAASRVICWRRG